MEKILTVGKCHNHLWFVFLIFILLSFILLLFDNTALTGRGDDQNGVTFLVNNFVNHPVTKQPKSSSLDLCSGRYIYMHHLPTQFNDDLLRNCRSLVKWNDMCPYISNMGLGPRVDNNPENVLSKKGWFSTNQFTLEVIFHNRMKHYECLTNDSSLASAIYVPFYAGLDVGRHLWGFNISVRDASSFSLLKWLSQKPEWRRMWGRDHFLVGGRISWDFRRKTDDDSDWGSKLMFLPESKNMTLLSIESSSWNNDFAIPYPTYFHPSKKSQVTINLIHLPLTIIFYHFLIITLIFKSVNLVY